MIRQTELIEMNCPYPLGVSGSCNQKKFSVYAPDIRECTLWLYKEGEQEPVLSVKAEQLPMYPGIFSCCVSLSENVRYEYIYESEKGFFLDERAVQYSGHGRFGEVPANGDVPAYGVRACVMQGTYERQPDCIERRSIEELVIYKLHVRNFTAHASSKVKHKGTFKGVTEKINYLRKLGINAVMLMPCTEFNELSDIVIPYGSRNAGKRKKDAPQLYAYAASSSEPRLNVWGYGAEAAYFAPKASYAAEPSEVCLEFSEMVKALHKAGIEVLLEMDFAKGTNKSLIIDSLRYWAHNYNIDGFKLNRDTVPLAVIADDPYLSDIKLISEGFNNDTAARKAFGGLLAAADDGYMTDMRRFIKGDEGMLKTAVSRMINGADKVAAVNYAAGHDSFTIRDTYSYDVKHNEANGENNRDGRELNYSWNCGAEGATSNRTILALRKKMIMNSLAVLFLSRGVPMLMAGDEFGNTNFGNNNPYCCDNEQGQVVWESNAGAVQLRRFTAELIKLRSMCREIIKDGSPGGSSSYGPEFSVHGVKAWTPDYEYFSRTFGLLFNGKINTVTGEEKRNAVYVVVNMHWEPHEFDIPTVGRGKWSKAVETADAVLADNNISCLAPPRSITVLTYEEAGL